MLLDINNENVANMKIVHNKLAKQPPSAAFSSPSESAAFGGGEKKNLKNWGVTYDCDCKIRLPKWS